MTRDKSDDITAAWQRVRDLRMAAAGALVCTCENDTLSSMLQSAAREYLRLYGAVGDAACYAALGGIESEIARLTCEELVR